MIGIEVDTKRHKRHKIDGVVSFHATVAPRPMHCAIGRGSSAVMPGFPALAIQVVMTATAIIVRELACVNTCASCLKGPIDLKPTTVVFG